MVLGTDLYKNFAWQILVYTHYRHCRRISFPIALQRGNLSIAWLLRRLRCYQGVDTLTSCSLLLARQMQSRLRQYVQNGTTEVTPTGKSTAIQADRVCWRLERHCQARLHFLFLVERGIRRTWVMSKIGKKLQILADRKRKQSPPPTSSSSLVCKMEPARSTNWVYPDQVL